MLLAHDGLLAGRVDSVVASLGLTPKVASLVNASRTNGGSLWIGTLDMAMSHLVMVLMSSRDRPEVARTTHMIINTDCDPGSGTHWFYVMLRIGAKSAGTRADHEIPAGSVKVPNLS